MNRQIFLILILAAAVAITGYLLWSNQQNAAPAPEETKKDQPFQQQIQNLRRLKNLKLDTSVFANPIFQSLDTGVSSPVDVSGGQKGRPNPFLPF